LQASIAWKASVHGSGQQCIKEQAMNQLTGQKSVVLDRLQQLINAFTQDGPLIQQIMNARLFSSGNQILRPFHLISNNLRSLFPCSVKNFTAKRSIYLTGYWPSQF
jgi:hypothetical protein